jgi:hypothetical protein
MTKLEEIRERVEYEGDGSPLYYDLLALCEEQDRELRKAVRCRDAYRLMLQLARVPENVLDGVCHKENDHE